MSDAKRPTETPPDLPPEYAEAYRRGYERAYREAAGAAQELPTQRGPADAEETLVDVPAIPADPAEAAAEEPRDADEPLPAEEPRHAAGPKHADEARHTEESGYAAEAPHARGASDAVHWPGQAEEPAHAVYRRRPGEDPHAEQLGQVANPKHADVPRHVEQPEHQEETAFDRLFAPAEQPSAGPRHADEPRCAEDPEGNAFDRLFAPVEQPSEEHPEPAHRGDTREDKDRPGWLVPLLLGALVIVLLVGAYGIGRVFSTSVGGADVSAGKPDGVEVGDTPFGSEDSAGEDTQAGDASPRPSRYQGRVNSAAIGSASASCQSPSSVDAAGNPVEYPPSNLHDGDMSTAWRCNGAGIGQTVTLTLPQKIKIGEVGLVPGYAKTDPRNGVDRYAENNRITKVRWTFPDGTSFVQNLDGSADNRSMQTRRVPVIAAGEVVIEILDSVRGSRNTVAISEVRIGQVA